MVTEDLLFWIAPVQYAPTSEPSLLCRRHADAMVVPRGWTLDDRREPMPRLFNTRAFVAGREAASLPRRRDGRGATAGPRPEQMQIDGTGEIARPDTVSAAEPPTEPIEPADDPGEPAAPWHAGFDEADDLGGLLQVDSPLLSRAFRGTDRPKS